MGTAGTVAALAEHGIAVAPVRKIAEGRPNLLDHLANGRSPLIVNTPSGKGARTDEGRIRAAAVSHGVPCITTIAGAKAAVGALERLRQGPLERLRPAGPPQALIDPRPIPHRRRSCPMPPSTEARATLDDLYAVEGKAELIGGRIVQFMASGNRPGVALEIAIASATTSRRPGAGSPGPTAWAMPCPS